MLEDILEQVRKEIRPEWGWEEFKALAAARIEQKYRLIDRDDLNSLKKNVHEQGHPNQ